MTISAKDRNVIPFNLTCPLGQESSCELNKACALKFSRRMVAQQN